jgi:hypothetical protein
VCGKASGEEEIKAHIVGACSSVICMKPDETSRVITVVEFMSVMCILKNIHFTGIRSLTGIVQH